MNTKEAIERVRTRFDKWALDNEDLTALQALGLVTAESEDARIRKWIIDFAKGQIDGFSLVDDEECNKIASQWRKAIAYLEKQKEEEGYEAIPVESTLEYKLGFKAGEESERMKEQSISANDLDEEIHSFFYDCIDVHEAKLYGSVSERVIPVDCYEITARHFAKWGEKQKEQIPYTDFVIKPHKGDDSNPYDMSVSEAQEYAAKRGFDIRFNDGEVYIDERHLTQTIGNILRWADEHPKEKKPNKEGMRAWFIIKDGEVVGEPLGYPCEKAAVIEKMVLESRDDKGIYEIEPREFEIVFKKTENPGCSRTS